MTHTGTTVYTVLIATAWSILLVHARTFSVTVSVDWAASVAPPVQITPSLQVVSQRLLWRDSPIHNASFASLKAASPRNSRFVPWIPYPRTSVAELQPPSGPWLCGPQYVGAQVGSVTLSCGAETISSIDFASFGHATGICGNFQVRLFLLITPFNCCFNCIAYCLGLPGLADQRLVPRSKQCRGGGKAMSGSISMHPTTHGFYSSWLARALFNGLAASSGALQRFPTASAYVLGFFVAGFICPGLLDVSGWRCKCPDLELWNPADVVVFPR